MLVRKKSRLLIICPLADIYSGVGNFGAPPLGPWRLAHYLQANGQHVDVWDCNVSESLKLPAPSEHIGRDRSEVLAEAFVASIETDFDVASFDWVGFSILNDTLPTSIGVVQLLRQKHPQVRLVGGNHEATVNLTDLLSKSKLDALVLADAEEPMLSLMRGVEPSKVSGVVWRNFNPKPTREQFETWNRLIRWGDIPYHAYWKKTAALYDLATMPEEQRLDKIYEINTVRIHTLLACELACSFCSVKNTRRIASGSMKPSIINLSVDALAENLLAIKAQVPDVMTIYDSSDEAFLGRGRGEEYCQTLLSVKPQMDAGLSRGMRYLIQCRTNDLSESLVELCARAGVKHLTIGVEGATEQVRKDMRKPQSEKQVRDAIRWGEARGVNMYCLFIMFYPTITLEQLRESVENWHVYMDLGATISVEPFCMSYLGTDLADDASYLTEYAGYDIPFSGTPARRLKWATLIWPADRRVCAIEQWFRENVDAYIEAALKRLGHRHAFKGVTGRVTVECLAEALKLYDAGKIRPWEPGEGRRSAVYQDYGDQMSGAEIASVMQNKTATRFNSTHATLDDSTNNGVRGRIKDPALPHELLVKE